MFGKKQPSVVTADEVGDYVKQLQQEGEKELIDYVTGDDDDGVANSSRTDTNGTEPKG